MNNDARLVVVSNRLPVTARFHGDSIRLQPSSGGLVSGLLPVVRKCGGCWIAAADAECRQVLLGELNGWTSTERCSLEPVFLSEEERDGFYRGYSNEIIWPLFHGLPSLCTFGQQYWNRYREVNERFGDAVQRVSKPGDLIWIHDYHLMLLAQTLRSRGLRERLVYFHHIPFPAPDVLDILPCRAEILRALMRFDVIGFQTSRDQSNFVACLRRRVPGVQVKRAADQFLALWRGSWTSVKVAPISIDYERFASDAADREVVSECESIRSSFKGSWIVLAVDRLDYTKGILQRLTAFKAFLERNPELHERVTFVQVVVPSREEISEYKQLKVRIENLVSSINGCYGRRGWVPVHYLYRHLAHSELVAFYRAADIAWITPVRDGMNLVAKEFCASRIDNDGVLVLSEFAGAAHELAVGALIVNPNSLEEMIAALQQAFRMSRFERSRRMLAMRAHLRTHDVFKWAQSFTAGRVPGRTVVAPSPAGIEVGA
jgi:trehalose 6-phosphate synthase